MKITKKTDEQALIGQMADGDEAAFNEIYRRYHKLIFYVAKRSCYRSDDVDDIVQETFLTIKEHAKELRNPKYFRLWIYRIISSKCNNLYRHNSRQISNFDDSFFSNNLIEERMEHVPSKAVRFQSDADILNDCIDQLPQAQKIVIMMYYFEHLPINEIAQCLELPVGTVKSRMSTARNSLKKMLEAIEQKQEGKVDFQSLEVLLPLAYTTAFAKLVVPGVAPKIQFRKNFNPAKQAFKFVQTHTVIATTSALVLGTGAVALPQLVKEQKKNSLTNTALIEQTQNTFHPILLLDKRVDTAKKGFFTLQLYACCKEDIADISNEKIQEMIPLYEEMKQNGGSYYEELKQSGWVEAFEFRIKK